ncbi:MAG: 16S rRNA (guanine(527)-N(7))-methyltransferase RsmG [Sphingomonas sp.]|jgi:16S rRNA (guanine527-N7)-methyltransferase
MTEGEARTWVRERFGVSRETAVAAFVDLVVAESERQNLISKATLEVVWLRHILDSAQLIDLVPRNTRPGPWVDIGTGAGFPGMVVALLTDQPVMLVEPRRKRAEFLQGAAQHLGIADRVQVHAQKVEQINADASVISARAVAPLPELLGSARHISSRSTVWLLPKGINAREEVEAARRTWHGSFHVEHSVTQPGSLIIIATDVSPR